MLFLSELKPFVDTEIRFSCARNYHLYTLTYLCCNLCDSLRCCCCSVSVMSNSLWPHELQYARLPCPPLSPGVCSSSCPFFAYSTLLPVFSPKQRGPQRSFRSSQNYLRGLKQRFSWEICPRKGSLETYLGDELFSLHPSKGQYVPDPFCVHTEGTGKNLWLFPPVLFLSSPERLLGSHFIHLKMRHI